MTVCRKGLPECAGRTQCYTCTYHDVQALVSGEDPTAWVGPQGQVMMHDIYKAWAKVDPKNAKTYQKLYTPTQVLDMCVRLVGGIR